MLMHSELGDFLMGRFEIIDSIFKISIRPFKFFISSYISLNKLLLSRNLYIFSKNLNYLA